MIGGIIAVIAVVVIICVIGTAVNISNADLMTHKTFKLVDGNGLAFVDGYVGSYVNK